MRKVAMLVILVGLFSSLLMAQETPKVEVFGGYQYAHSDVFGTGLNFNGWNASITGNANKYLGVAADFSGNYKSQNGASLKIYSYTFGPVVSLNHEGTVNPFVHALFGGATANLSADGVGSTNSTGFSMALGGGADAKVTPRIAIRVIQADWVYYHFEGQGLSKNVRISTGLVFRF